MARSGKSKLLFGSLEIGYVEEGGRVVARCGEFTESVV